jgi:hypothetical protein
VSLKGEYRALYVAFADDTDVHALTGDAFKLLVLLKLSLPVSGIGVIYPSKLCDQVNCDRAHLDVIMAELERPKSGRARGWIVREKNVVWIVNALAFEPGLTPTNANHQKYVQKLVAQLDERQNIVSEFKTAYHHWFQRPTKGIRKGSETHPDPKQEQSNDKNKASTKQSNKSGDLDLERDAAPRARSAGRAAPLATALAELPQGAIRFLTHFYGRGKANTDRRTDVAQQIVATLNGGARFKRARILAMSRERLEEKCREVIEEGVNNRDKAIVVLLTKLADSNDITSAAVAADHHERSDEERHTAADVTHAEAWLLEHPDVAAAIDADIEQRAVDGHITAGPFAESAVRMLRTSLVLTAWRDAGAPEAVHA